MRLRFTLLSLLTLAPAVWAHPHSFIDMQATLIQQQNALTGIEMRWTMDEITSADLLYDAGDAKAGSEIWKKLAAEVMANVLAQHYFTEFYHGGQPVKFKNLPPSYRLLREGRKAVLEFVLPLATPQPLKGQTFHFSTFDPSYFVDMHYESALRIALPAGMEACNITLDTPAPDASLQAYALSLDKADAPPEEMDLGQQFAQRVTLTCQ
ncbi:DUF1007 family protein [Nissabacter sp. SGAir0207]|uniref:DUF1007 family protein n=1 Tax=Nissabacter sp. SGAir0207 TaxID=2126321 RepID=UPI0010CD438C|nr:DUF1007 family protein [Nissabacter sp. SGAir0207]QCR38165.1 DUF1007 domain-containing protein [Nissabacter sp. SGAir0207]